MLMNANDLAALRIREIVASKGLKGTYIDKEMNRAKNWLTRAVNGRKQIELQDLVDLAIILDVPVTVFFMPKKSTKS